MKIEECKGARVHAALTKSKKGVSKISWKINYKNESVWCNSLEEVSAVLKKISLVQLHGKEYKTWEVGKDGWQLNSKKEDKNAKNINS